MTYRSDDGSETEQIWNSRDGVTPFVIRSRSGKEMTHVNWQHDKPIPNHRLKHGDRFFGGPPEEPKLMIQIGDSE